MKTVVRRGACWRARYRLSGKYAILGDYTLRRRAQLAYLIFDYWVRAGYAPETIPTHATTWQPTGAKVSGYKIYAEDPHTGTILFFDSMRKTEKQGFSANSVKRAIHDRPDRMYAGFIWQYKGIASDKLRVDKR